MSGLKKRSKSIASLLIGTSIIACEIILLSHGIAKELQDDYIDNEPAFYCSIWMFFLIPFYIFSGVGIISVKPRKIIGKLISSPLFGVFSSIIYLYIGDTYLDVENFTWLIKFIKYAPLISLIIFLTLKYIGNYDKD
jgi:hypothetical protein